MDEVVKKNGLVYTADLKTVLGLDTDAKAWDGKVPNGVESIAEEAFSCIDTKSIVLPDTVKSVGASLFCNSTNLESVKLSKTLRTLSPYMFCGCTSLKSVELPYEIEDFTEGLFAECKSLTSIPFRAGIKTLPEGVFDSCSSITSLVIPPSVERIAKGAIVNCESLTTIVLPKGLKEFEEGAIKNCPKLSRIRLDEENKLYKTNEDSTKLLKKVGSSYMEVYTAPCKTLSAPATIDISKTPPNPSILSYEDDEEGEEEGNNTESAKESGTKGVNMQDNSNSDGVTQITTKGMNVINTEPDITAANSAVNVDEVERRLSEIMNQEKQYSEENFTIMDIPEATEEEMQSERITAPVISQKINHTSTQNTVTERTTPGHTEVKEEYTSTTIKKTTTTTTANIQEKVDEITKDNITDSSVGVTNIQVESQDEPDENAPITHKGVASESEERLAMNDIIFETEKVKQEVIDADSDAVKILFVFSEALCQTQFGNDFSSKLVKCAERLAAIHKFTSIFYFYGVDISNASFRKKFMDYMKNKNTLIACTAGNLTGVSDKIKEFANYVGVRLDKDEQIKQASVARDPDGSTVLKLLIQDIMD